MDWVSLKKNGIQYLQKYRYVLLVLLAGVFLMALPDAKKTDSHPQTAPPEAAPEVSQPALQESLSEILSKLSGAGRVEVLLTQHEGERTIYQTDEDISTGETTSSARRETVLITNASREETGLIRQVNPPVYQGAIILCQGADSASVRLSLVEAVANATGLSTDKITVLKMK